MTTGNKCLRGNSSVLTKFTQMRGNLNLPRVLTIIWIALANPIGVSEVNPGGSLDALTCDCQ